MSKKHIKVKLNMPFDEAMKRLLKVKLPAFKTNPKISNIPRKSKKSK